MKVLDFIRCALTCCVAVVILASCGGSQPPIGALGAMPQTNTIARYAEQGKSQKPRAWRLGYKGSPPLLYSVNNENWNVAVYRAKAKDPSPLATITDGLSLSFGACIDDQGTLYVTNEPPSAGWVSEYPLGETTPSTIIKDGISEPAYCTIDVNGNLWVANAGGANVAEYLKGSKKPHLLITNSLVHPVGIAFDRSGNLYVGNGYGAPQQNVEVYAPGSTSPSRTIINGVTSPTGLAVDANGTLYVANVYQNTVAEYRSGQDDPFQTITQAIEHPGALTVDKKGVLYVSNIGNSRVVEFASGALTPLKRQISKGLSEPTGVAFYPPLLP